MQIIPVLDLKEGQAVHAVRGQRAHYRPVDGVLGHGRDPLRLALAFRDRLGCRTLYAADLDAIGGAPGHDTLIRAIATAGLTLWVDAGAATSKEARALADLGASKVIVGSETLRAPAQIEALANDFPARNLLLSVDMMNGVLRAPAGVNSPEELVAPAAATGWAGIILLDLAHVGASAGPSFEPLLSLKKQFPHLPFYVGGGARRRSDLDALAQAGAAGALVATALHLGVLTKENIGLSDLAKSDVKRET